MKMQRFNYYKLYKTEGWHGSKRQTITELQNTQRARQGMQQKCRLQTNKSRESKVTGAEERRHLGKVTTGGAGVRSRC